MPIFLLHDRAWTETSFIKNEIWYVGREREKEKIVIDINYMERRDGYRYRNRLYL